LQLAPDIQEEILFLRPERGRDLVHLRQVRPIAAVLDWGQQRRLWRKLRQGQARPIKTSVLLLAGRRFETVRFGRPIGASQTIRPEVNKRLLTRGS
jgi:hypothetical protein